MEKKNSTSKASKASKNTKATVSNSKTSTVKSSKKTSAKEILFAGEVARKSNFKASKWELVSGTVRKFTDEELEAIHSIRLFQKTDKETGEVEYWFIKVLFEEEGEMYELNFSPDFKLIDKGEHGDYLDPKSFMWYKLTDGNQVIKRAKGKILPPEEEEEEEKPRTKKSKKGNYNVPF